MGDYTIKTFTNIGDNEWIVPENVDRIEYLVVAGGGGGGGSFDTGGGGGGGGGMVLTGYLSVSSGEVYNLYVGDGGTASSNNYYATASNDPNRVSETNGGDGENSYITLKNTREEIVISYGGQGGRRSRSTYNSFANGQNQDLSTTPPTSSRGGSGGGNNGVNRNGKGGNGGSSGITGLNITYGTGGTGGSNRYSGRNDPSNSSNNTGNGGNGGSAGSSSASNGSKGGSGIIVIKYITTETRTSSKVENILLVNSNVRDRNLIEHYTNEKTKYILYTIDKTPEDIIQTISSDTSINLSKIKTLGLMYHSINTYNIPFFNYDLSTNYTVEERLFSNKLRILVNYLKDNIPSNKLTVDLLSCELNQPLFKKRIKNIGDVMNIDIRYSLKMETGPNVFKNLWVMEYDTDGNTINKNISNEYFYSGIDVRWYYGLYNNFRFLDNSRLFYRLNTTTGLAERYYVDTDICGNPLNPMYDDNGIINKYSPSDVIAWGRSFSLPTTVQQELLNNVIAINPNLYAYAALKNDGTVVVWGDVTEGGDSSAVDADLNNIVSLYSTRYAYAALKNDGSVITWGDEFNGGDSSLVQSQLSSGVKHIYSTQYAFAALKEDGSVVVWGEAVYGGDTSFYYSYYMDVSGLTLTQPALENIVTIYSTSTTFAALRSDGKIVVWGSDESDYDDATIDTSLYSVYSDLSGVIAVYSNYDSFAALKSDGTVVTWGNYEQGGNSSSVQSQLTGVKTIFSNRFSYAALKNDGSVITWGDNIYGGNSSTVYGGNISSGVITIKPNDRSFAALKNDGSVVVWGNILFGGNFNVIYGGNVTSNVVALYSNFYSYAALKDDNSVVTWGYFSTVNPGRPITDVSNITSTDDSYAALQNDKTVEAWSSGISTLNGGDSSLVDSSLNDIIYIYSNFESFAALRFVEDIIEPEPEPEPQPVQRICCMRTIMDLYEKKGYPRGSYTRYSILGRRRR